MIRPMRKALANLLMNTFLPSVSFKTSCNPLSPLLLSTIESTSNRIMPVPMIQVIVGKEDMKDEEIVDNIITLYNNIVHHLPNEANNVKQVRLKLTMGKPVEIKK